jgi:GT2 family glycosyltransferase
VATKLSVNAPGQPVRPRVSVVIASVNGPAHLDECLGVLENQTQRYHYSHSHTVMCTASFPARKKSYTRVSARGSHRFWPPALLPAL